MKIIKTEKLEDGRLYVAAEPEGVCSQAIELLLKDGVVLQGRFHGGCSFPAPYGFAPTSVTVTSLIPVWKFRM